MNAHLQEDVQEDWGWKLVHGEVFRTPPNPMLLAIMVGNGAQLCAMVGVTLGLPSLVCHLYSITHLTISSISICPPGIPFPFEPRLACHCNDDLLDILRRVGRARYTRLWD
jgi:hypothetical protein